MQCNKINGKFLKVKAKVNGFLIAKIIKRNNPETEKRVPVVIKSKKNTITGLQYLINAFQAYMSGVQYTGETATSPGIVITTSSGQTFTLPFFTTPTVSATNNLAIIVFSVMDDSDNSYTAINEQLITTSAGFNIPIATANLSITKQSDETLTLAWIITVTVSAPGGILYLSTPVPQSAGWSCSNFNSSCDACTESGANSNFSGEGTSCSPTGILSQYPQTNLVTTQLFTDMFYNNYKTAPTNKFTLYVNGTLYIYTPYCMQYFIAGMNSGQPSFASYYNGTVCYTQQAGVNPVYIQVYVSNTSEAFVGVQIEFTT